MALKLIGIVLVITIPFLSAMACAQWIAKLAPIMTRWANDVSPDIVHQEYPRPQLVRSMWLNLNGVWEFSNGADASAPPFDSTLPGRILVPFPVESALSGMMERGERFWYRRVFAVPKQWDRHRVLLHFGAVDWEARVWVNGSFVGEHRGGYDGFTFDITDALADEGKNELIVGVWDPTDNNTQPRGKQVSNPRGIWYTPSSGIWQTVWLEPVPVNRIDGLRLVPDVDASTLRISVDERYLSDSLAIDAIVMNNGREIVRASGGHEMTVNIPHPKLWSPDNPHLYDLKISLRAADDPMHIVDEVTSYFGMRKIEIGRDKNGDTRMLINDEPIFHIGTLDQGFWPDGLYTAPCDEALRYDIEVTKQLGFNTIRKHVKIEPDRWYYWCDKLGVIVWQDMPSGDAYVAPGSGEIDRGAQSAEQFERELTRLITGFGNHPSIIMWVLFNEGWGQYDTARLAEYAGNLDPSRLISSASGWNDLGVGDIYDIHSYPGPAAPEPEAERSTVLGEFGGLGLPVEGHTWAERAWGYRGTEDSDELTRRYIQLMRGVWELRRDSALSAAIYTQITDVETECNGLLTYDREVVKVDIERIAAANRGEVPSIVPVLPSAKHEAREWRYTIEAPGEDWFETGFDDSKWTTGPAGFGTSGTPGAVVRTTWKTENIWLRREFTLDTAQLSELLLYVHHDEDAEIYINGVLAASPRGYTTAYEELPISDEARQAIRKGRNIIAIHCRQTNGGQYIDAGMVRLVPPSSK